MGSSLVGMSNLMSGAMSASSPAKPTLRQRLQKGLGKVDMDKLSKDAGAGAEVSDNNASLMSGGPAPIPNQFGSAMPSYDTGTPLISEDQIAQLHKGEAVVPAEENPNNPDNQKSLLGSAMPEKQEEAPLIPISKGARFVNVGNGSSPIQQDIDEAVRPFGSVTTMPHVASKQFSVVPPQEPEAPNPLVIANDAKKVEAGSKGDLIGLGSAVINERHALPKYVGPGSNKVAEGELIPRQREKENYQAEKMAAQQSLDQALKSGNHQDVLEARQRMLDVEQYKPRHGWAKAGHFFNEFGQALGNAYAPEIMAAIPGTELHKRFERRDIDRGLEQESLRDSRRAEKGSDYEFKTDDEGRMYRLDKSGKTPPQLVTFDNNGAMKSQSVSTGDQSAATNAGQDTLVKNPAASSSTQQQPVLGQAYNPQQAAYSGPTFGAKPEKLPIGADVAKQVNDQIAVLAQSLSTASVPAAEVQAFKDAFTVNEKTATGEADKRIQAARAAAQLNGQAFSTYMQRAVANQQHADAQASLNQQREFQRREEERREIDRGYQYQQTRLDKLRKPLDDTATRLGRLQDTLDQRGMQADSMVAPELLSVMAGGQGSGLRMNEAEIARIVGGRTAWEDLRAAANKWSADPSTARSITPEQHRQIQALMKVVADKIHEKQQVLADASNELLNAEADDKGKERNTESTKRAQREIVANAQLALNNIDKGLDHPVGSTIKQGDKTYTVTAVIDDPRSKDYGKVTKAEEVKGR